jgi:two-component sensor histidine kinase
LQDMRDTLSSDRPIKIELSSRSVRVPSKTAVSIGVIINELISNAAKHAFPDRGEGTVRVTVATGTDGRVQEICVEDDGVGAPPQTDDGVGLGGKIVQALSHSLDATLTVERVRPGSDRPGTRVRLTMREIERSG